MENLLERITIDSEICHGKPTIRGLRYPVESMSLIHDLLTMPFLNRTHGFNNDSAKAKSTEAAYLNSTLVEYERLSL